LCPLLRQLVLNVGSTLNVEQARFASKVVAGRIHQVVVKTVVIVSLVRRVLVERALRSLLRLFLNVQVMRSAVQAKYALIRFALFLSQRAAPMTLTAAQARRA
jgi:hypothetical protein